MFKLASEPTFTHPVKVKVPVDGGFVDQSFKATFRVEDVDAIQGMNDLEQQAELLRKVFVGFPEGEIEGDGDEAVSFSDALRDRLIATPYVRVGLIDAYLDGVLKARRGN